MKQRLEQLLNAENLSKAQFADSIKMARAGITHIMAGRNNPSYEFIINTMKAYPALNIEWLLTGTGSMYKVDETVQQSHEQTLFSIPDDIHDSCDTITTPLKKNAPTPKGRKHPSKIIVTYDDGSFEIFE